MYCRGLGFHVAGSFENHNGFDGVMLGLEGSNYHLEFTCFRSHPVAASPTAEDLLVFYLPDAADWQAACDRMLAVGFEQAPSFNPYWVVHGRTFRDPDGYRIVLQQDKWREGEKA
jgi:hypothetical protein